MKKSLIKRPAAERGHSDFGWLDSRHSFAFGEYQDPEHRGFHTLRVINDDRVSGGGGFGMHPHRDMEILSYVVEGGLTHRDSMGNTETVTAGGVQYMSAGSGVLHSEYNASADAPVHFLQIWVLPRSRGTTPRYQEWRPSPTGDGLVLLASPDGAANSLVIHQDVRIHLGRPGSGNVRHSAAADRAVWIQMVDGTIEVDGVALKAGDGLAIENPGLVEITNSGTGHYLLFDLKASGN